MDKVLENQLKGRIKPLFRQGRGGDWEHTLRAVEYGKTLLCHEAGESEVVIPALYLHDIGWSKVDFQDFIQTPPARKNRTMSLSLHMEYGARLAEEILRDLDYDIPLIGRIASIIATHDEAEKAFSRNDPSTTLVVEADRLDRYGPESLRRFSAMNSKSNSTLKRRHREEAFSYLREGLDLWFRTTTARIMALHLAKSTGLISDSTDIFKKRTVPDLNKKGSCAP